VELEGGNLVRVEVGERSFVVFAIGGDLYALDDRCSHKDEALSEVGVIDDGELECCAHGARFDPATGAPRAFPATKALATAQVRVIDGRVHVGIPTDAHEGPNSGRVTPLGRVI